MTGFKIFKSIIKIVLIVAIMGIAGVVVWDKYFAQDDNKKILVDTPFAPLLEKEFWKKAFNKQGQQEYEGIASGNGRIEAVEVDITARIPARVLEILATEGDMVEAGQILARMDTEDLQAQLREGEALVRQSQEHAKYVKTIVAQRKSEFQFANIEYKRTLRLKKQGHITADKLDRDLTAQSISRIALQAANIQVVEANFSIKAAEARVKRIQANINDSTLKSPVRGRVLYRLAEEGEVIGAGGRVLSLIKLSDVYMTIFLPTKQAGKVQVGSEARILLDAVPEYVIPASVSFIDARAQFTPRNIETRTEREKLMFRIKVKIDPSLLKKHIEKIKTGIPGDAFVRLDSQQEWPKSLQVKVP